MRKVFLAAVCAAVMWAAPGQMQAAPFSFSWTDTVSETGLPGTSIGDSFTFTIVVDNGGTTTASQTWTGDDFVSASININGGSFTETSTDIAYSSGVFQTDAESAIIAVPVWLNT